MSATVERIELNLTLYFPTSVFPSVSWYHSLTRLWEALFLSWFVSTRSTRYAPVSRPESHLPGMKETISTDFARRAPTNFLLLHSTFLGTLTHDRLLHAQYGDAHNAFMALGEKSEDAGVIVATVGASDFDDTGHLPTCALLSLGNISCVQPCLSCGTCASETITDTATPPFAASRRQESCHLFALQAYHGRRTCPPVLSWGRGCPHQVQGRQNQQRVIRQVP